MVGGARPVAGWVSVLAMAVAGCSFHTSVPAGSDIACSETEPCPSGYSCQLNVHRCLTLSALAQPAPALSNAALTPTVGNLQTPFALTFDVSTALAQAPVAYASAVAGADQTYPFTCTTCGPGATCTCTFVAGGAQPSPPEGSLHVWVQLENAVGNEPPPFEVGTLEIDLTPPTFVPPAQLSITPPAGVTVPVTELGPGGGAQVCFTVDEALGVAPLVWAGSSDGGLPFALESGFPLGMLYCYSASVSADAGSGSFGIGAQLEDVAGNVALVQLIDGDGGLVIDTVPPLSPDTSVDGGLVFHRAPWGELPNLGQPVFTVGASGNAISKAGTLIVYADATRQQPIAEVPVAGGPIAPAQAIPGPDRASIYVDLVDQAGTYAPGGPFLVHDEEWVGTLGGKVAGDALSNPNDCYARPVAETALEQADDPVTVQGTPGAAPTRIAGAAAWRERFIGVPDFALTAPPQSAVLTYDTARARAVMVVEGPVTVGPNGVPVLGTYEWDGDWHPLTSASEPPFRGVPGFSYDPRLGRSLMFGGDIFAADGPGSVFCDLWAWDGTTWSELIPCAQAPDGGGTNGAAPPPRGGPAMAYDPRRGVTLVVGGDDINGYDLNDQWQFDGQQWSELSGDAGLPIPRDSATMAYAAFADGGGGMALVGGIDEATGALFLNDTWFGVWNGSTYAWTQAIADTQCNSGLDCDGWSIAPDWWGTGLVIATTNQFQVDLWRWTGSTWDPVSSIASYGVAGFVPTPGASDGTDLLLIGTGSTESDGSTGAGSWSCDAQLDCSLQHDGAADVSGRQAAAVAFDPQGRGLLYGGISHDAEPDSALYLWNGADWFDVVVDGGPPGRIFPALAFNAEDGRWWMSGGYADAASTQPLTDLWAFDLTRGWSYLGSLAADPAGGTAESLLYVPSGYAHGMVEESLFLTQAVPDPMRIELWPDGGLGLDDLLNPANEDGPLAFDGSTGQMALLGDGTCDLAELANDGGWFLEVGGAGQSPDRLFYDTAGARLLELGQLPYTPVAGDVFEVNILDAGGWGELRFADPDNAGAPPDEQDSAAAFDPARGRLLVYGGVGIIDGLQTGTDETWELAQAPLRPAMVCQLRFANAEAAPGATLLALEVGASGGADPGGAALELWENGQWTTVAGCDGGCGTAAPASFSYQTTDPTELARALLDLDTVGLAVESIAPNGAGYAQVAAGPMQATVTFRLP